MEQCDHSYYDEEHWQQANILWNEKRQCWELVAEEDELLGQYHRVAVKVEYCPLCGEQL